MSTLQLLLKAGRLAPTSGLLPVKSMAVIKYPICSNYRSIWSSFVGSNNKETAAAEPVESQSQALGQDAQTPEMKTQKEDLIKALQEMKDNRDDLNDKYRRALAENENIRKRFSKQVEDMKVYAIQGFCKDLLEVADVLSRATESVPKEEINDSNPHLKNLYEGLTMTENVLKSVFNRHGLSVIDPLNEKFNPNFHEALFEQEVQGKPPGTVVVVSKTGYALHERVIRPALVGVSK